MPQYAKAEKNFAALRRAFSPRLRRKGGSEGAARRHGIRSPPKESRPSAGGIIIDEKIFSYAGPVESSPHRLPGDTKELRRRRSAATPRRAVPSLFPHGAPGRHLKTTKRQRRGPDFRPRRCRRMHHGVFTEKPTSRGAISRRPAFSPRRQSSFPPLFRRFSARRRPAPPSRRPPGAAYAPADPPGDRQDTIYRI